MQDSPEYISVAKRGSGAVAVCPVHSQRPRSLRDVTFHYAQHPLVYKISSAWDTMTAESDEGIGVRELRRLDPSFSVEDWKKDIQDLFLPEFMSAFLRVRCCEIGRERPNERYACASRGMCTCILAACCRLLVPAMVCFGVPCLP